MFGLTNTDLEALAIGKYKQVSNDRRASMPATMHQGKHSLRNSRKKRGTIAELIRSNSVVSRNSAQSSIYGECVHRKDSVDAAIGLQRGNDETLAAEVSERKAEHASSAVPQERFEVRKGLHSSSPNYFIIAVKDIHFSDVSRISQRGCQPPTI